MDHFYIITNHQKDKDYSFTKSVKEYLLEHGKTCFTEEERKNSSLPYPYRNEKWIPEETEAVIVLGGDGTLIRAAGNVAFRKIPFLGINLGTLGYLIEIDHENVFQALDQVLAGEYEIENRMMLECEVSGSDKKWMALNDVVFHRQGVFKIMNFHVSVNGRHLNTYNGDGIIIATPTGSTGYSMSAGGPIVEPKAEMLVITPICPHTLNSKSIVLSPDDEIVIEMAKRGEDQEEAAVMVDGEVAAMLVPGDKIVIRRSAQYTKLIKIGQVGFLDALRKKMQESK